MATPPKRWGFLHSALNTGKLCRPNCERREVDDCIDPLSAMFPTWRDAKNFSDLPTDVCPTWMLGMIDGMARELSTPRFYETFRRLTSVGFRTTHFQPAHWELLRHELCSAFNRRATEISQDESPVATFRPNHGADINFFLQALEDMIKKTGGPRKHSRNYDAIEARSD
jgi:hypothetical protein